MIAYFVDFLWLFRKMLLPLRANLKKEYDEESRDNAADGNGGHVPNR